MIDFFKDALKTFGVTLLLILIAMLLIVGGLLFLQAMFGPTDEQRAMDRVPAVVSSADGCTVYRFYDNSSWHYFTKCGGTVTTTKNYTENCGKGCTRSRTENMTTEGNQP
jgi:hypothetical protein